jgi:phage terminase large subunit
MIATDIKPIEINVDIDESVFNKAYLPYLDDERFYQILKGGGSAGKSNFCAQKITYKIMEKIGYNVMAMRKHNVDNHETTFAELCKCIRDWNLSDLFKINHSKGQEEIKCINHNKIIFKGLDNIEKRKGTTFETGPLAVIWGDEATEWLENDLNQMVIRLRGEADVIKYMMLSFNPIDIDHFIKKRFFDIKLDPKDGFILETTYKDNEFLTERDIKELERFKDIDKYYYEVYVLNHWGDINTARVFHNYVVEDFSYNEDTLDSLCTGMDFGTIHASAIIDLGYKDGEIYIYDELYGKGWTNADFIGQYEEKIRLTAEAKYKHIKEERQRNYYVSRYIEQIKNKPIIADSAEPDRILEWKRNGYNVRPAKKGLGSLGFGVDYLSRTKVHIHKRCIKTAWEFGKYKRRQDKDGNIMEKAFVEMDDDTVAACRYATEHIWNRKGGVEISINERIW